MKKRKDPNVYPPGWSEAKTKAVADYYDRQSEDAAVAEDLAAFAQQSTLMVVPTALVNHFAAQIQAFQSRGRLPSKKRTTRRKAG